MPPVPFRRRTLLTAALTALMPVAALAAPDASLKSVTAPAFAAVGYPVTLEVTLGNTGTTLSGPVDLGVYLSSDSLITVFDKSLGKVAATLPDPGETTTVSVTVNVPADVALGTWSLGVVVDPLNALGEVPATMLDNTKAGAPRTILKAPAPDFAPARVAWPAKTAAGDVVPVEYVVENRGVQAGTATVGVILSANDRITTNDLVAARFDVDLGAGTQASGVAWVKLPTGLAPATYVAGLRMDPDDAVAELDETNNTVAGDPGEVAVGSLVIDTGWLSNALVGVPFVQRLSASGGSSAYSWSLVAGALPKGLELTADGTLAGTPSERGSFAPVFQVSSGADEARQAFVLRVREATASLEVATTALPAAYVGRPYESSLAAAGGAAPYRWRVTQGSLPAGLSLTGGALVGTANKAESAAFTVEATDVGGNVAVRALTLRVLDKQSLSIAQTLVEDATLGGNYAAKLEPSGGTAPYRWTLAGGRLPAGLALASNDDGTASLSGRPQQSGNFAFGLRLEDAAGEVDRNTFMLHVVSSEVRVLTAELPSATRGAAYDEELTTDARGPVWRLASGHLPAGVELTVDGHLRASSGTIPDTTPLGRYTFLVEVTDATGSVGRGGFTLEVTGTTLAADSSSGCSQTGFGWLMLAPLALLARRRRAAGAAIIAASMATSAAKAADEFTVVDTPETFVPLTSVWIDDVAVRVGGGAGTNLVANGDASDTSDDLNEGNSWATLSTGGSNSAAWVRCRADASAGSAAAPAIACAFDTDGGSAGLLDKLQLVQTTGAFLAGDTIEVSYCLKGAVSGQQVTVKVVSELGTSLGYSKGATLSGAFACTTDQFVATGPGPARLAIQFADPAAEVHSLELVDYSGDVDSDEGVAAFDLPFTFPFFGKDRSKAWVSTNGLLSFSSLSYVSSNQELPDEYTPNSVIAPWWDDLETPDGAAGEHGVRWRLTGTAPARVLVIEWAGMERYAYSGSGGRTVTFQAELFEDGGLSFRYGALGSGTGDNFSASVGVEDEDGVRGASALGCGDSCDLGDFPSGHRISFVRLPDLVVSAVEVPRRAWADLDASFGVTIENLGSLGAEGVVARLWLSTDAAVDPGDALLWSSDAVSLARGDKRTFAVKGHVPDGTVPGPYRVIATVDADDAAVEAVESNNEKAGAVFPVGAPAPDCAATDVTLSNATVEPGQAFDLGASVRNLGNEAGTCSYRWVLSVNDVLSPADVALGSGSETLAKGASTTVSRSVTVPADLRPGVYKVGLVLDVEAPGVTEVDEFNNSAKAAQALTVRGALTIVTEAVPEGALGAVYGYRLETAGGDGLALWSLVSGSALPAGITLSPLGELSGVPQQTGTFAFTAKALTANDDASKGYVLEVRAVARGLALGTTVLTSGAVGRSYAARVVAVGGTPPYRFVVDESVGALPPGLAIDLSTGIIEGAPSLDGRFVVGLSVTDAAGTTVAGSASLSVAAAGRPVVGAAALPGAAVGHAYDATLVAVGGAAPYSWTLVTVRRTTSAGTFAVPAVDGLALDGAGRLTGSPTSLGLYALIVKVKDAGGFEDAGTVLLEVSDASGVAVLTDALPAATVGAAYDQRIVVAGGDGAYAFSLAEGSVLLDGLTLDGDGRVRGTPTAPGRTTVVVHVADGAGHVDFHAVFLEVRAAAKAESGCAQTGAAPWALLAVAAMLLMRRRTPRGVVSLGMVAAFAIALAGAQGCQSPAAVGPCDGLSCQPGETCDPVDGLCKCGGTAGRACTAAEACNPQSLACEILDRCLLVRCARGMACDPADGQCRCGAAVCGSGERCDAANAVCVAGDKCAGVVCAGGTTCDVADGVCKCGGALCEAGQRCSGGSCVADPCAGAACTGGTTCDPADGQCRCGDAGPVCSYGQACDTATKKCVLSSKCAGVRCGGGASCDPADGQCHCGGSDGEVCIQGQTCDAPRKACVGGNRCLGKQCAEGETCDPEDGTCHCGSGALACASGETCDVVDGRAPACRRACALLAQTGCAAGEACTLDDGTGRSWCGTAGNVGINGSCVVAGDCQAGLSCHDFFDYGSFDYIKSCLPLCTYPGGTCAGSGYCEQIEDTDFGACEP